MAEEMELVNTDEYLDRSFGTQTNECSETNLMRAMDFTGFIFNKLTFEVMLELFEVYAGRRWCDSKWASWVAAGKSVWWLWTVLDKPSKSALCNWYITSHREIRGQ